MKVLPFLTQKGGPHSDKCTDSTALFLTSITLDCRGAMSKRVEELCLHDFKLTAQDIANQVMTEFNTTNKGKAFDFIPKEKMKTLVYYFRQREYGEWESLVYYSIVPLRFHFPLSSPRKNTSPFYVPFVFFGVAVSSWNIPVGKHPDKKS